MVDSRRITFIIGIIQFLIPCLFAQTIRPESLFIEPKKPSPRLSMKITVNWEKTRTGFGQNGIASETTSFLEEWTITIMKPYDIKLASPRGQVDVIGIGPFDKISRTPSTLILDEPDLAFLLGITYQFETNEENNPIAWRYPVHFLDIRSDRSENHLTIKPNRDQMISIVIEFNK